MLNTSFSVTEKEELKLLLLGAHCDDIEIGCGGTLLKLIEEYDNISVKWVVFSSNEVRKREAQQSADMFLDNVSWKNVTILEFKDSFFPSIWSEIKEAFENLKREFAPDIIFTHYRNDLHQDHRIINELTWNTFRNHLIFEYEIPKYDGDLGKPNLFVPLDSGHLERKKEILFSCFKSQLDKQWFNDSLLTSISILRGIECVSASKYAESFYCRKMTI